jgi:hypothetical protein
MQQNGGNLAEIEDAKNWRESLRCAGDIGHGNLTDPILRSLIFDPPDRESESEASQPHDDIRRPSHEACASALRKSSNYSNPKLGDTRD